MRLRPHAGMKKKILAVDNDPNVLASYEAVLHEDRVVRSPDAGDALLKLQNEDFQLIITELKLPGNSGDRFIQTIERDFIKLRCPILISSAKLDPLKVELLGINPRIHFLLKPASKEELRDKVGMLLGEKKKSPVDVRFINPVLEATIHTLSTMTGVTLSAGKPYVKQSSGFKGDITGVVGVVSSGFRGTIALSFEAAGFLKVMSKMLGTEFKQIDAENRDGITELLNIIFGQAKKVLNGQGLKIQSAIPTIVMGNETDPEHYSSTVAIVIPFTSPDFGECTVEVCVAGV